MASPSSQLPEARLVVTGTTPTAPPSSHSTAPASPLPPSAPRGAISTTLPRPPPAGVIFCITDIPAGGKAPMHRTLSIDYAVVLSGEIVCILDGGDERTIRTGEFIVGRGVNHAWHNRTHETCRMLAVMVGAQKIVLKDGKALEETVFGKKPE
ncbi:hypothetical protein B0H11DRAFT_2135072 [Mycena galericulata]|nr:hypothetical protein B0H11DRAFT_2135072 [Mycena galericulata]